MTKVCVHVVNRERERRRVEHDERQRIEGFERIQMEKSERSVTNEEGTDNERKRVETKIERRSVLEERKPV